MADKQLEKLDMMGNELSNLGLKIRAIAYLLESHNPELAPEVDSENVWNSIGLMLDDVGKQILCLSIQICEINYQPNKVHAKK